LKRSLNKKWLVLAAALVLTLSIGGAAFAAAGSSTTDASAATMTAETSPTTPDAQSTAGTGKAADTDQPWSHQRSDETLLTGDVAAKVQAAAVAKVGSDATVVRVETDADGNAKYEVHMVKSDGTPTTVYVDESYNVVSVQDGGPGGGHGRGDCDGDGTHKRGQDSDDSGSTSSGSSSTTTGASSTTY
jgi:uncharacterized membrane protein YkoI